MRRLVTIAIVGLLCLATAASSQPETLRSHTWDYSAEEHARGQQQPQQAAAPQQPAQTLEHGVLRDIPTPQAEKTTEQQQSHQQAQDAQTDDRSTEDQQHTSVAQADSSRIGEHFHRVPDRYSSPEELMVLSHYTLPTEDPRRLAEVHVEQRYRPLEDQRGGIVSEEVTYVETFDSRRLARQQQEQQDQQQHRELKGSGETQLRDSRDHASLRLMEDKELEKVQEELFVR